MKVNPFGKLRSSTPSGLRTLRDERPSLSPSVPRSLRIEELEEIDAEHGRSIKLLIGLGNPGKEYEKTYHNAGFLFIQYLMNKKPANSEFRIQNLELLKSDVYMNESGKFVAKILKKHGVKPEEILIVHDDSDIESGKYKISFGRGSAGHNGVQSIINTIKTKNFWRLRIGIRPRGDAKLRGKIRETTRKKASEFVLKKIGKKNLKVFEKMFSEINFNAMM